MIAEVYDDIEIGGYPDLSYDVANRVKEKFKDFMDVDLGGLSAI